MLFAAKKSNTSLKLVGQCAFVKTAHSVPIELFTTFRVGAIIATRRVRRLLRPKRSRTEFVTGVERGPTFGASRRSDSFFSPYVVAAGSFKTIAGRHHGNPARSAGQTFDGRRSRGRRPSVTAVGPQLPRNHDNLRERDGRPRRRLGGP